MNARLLSCCCENIQKYPYTSSQKTLLNLHHIYRLNHILLCQSCIYLEIYIFFLQNSLKRHSCHLNHEKITSLYHFFHYALQNTLCNEYCSIFYSFLKEILFILFKIPYLRIIYLKILSLFVYEFLCKSECVSFSNLINQRSYI